jgi:hypothetical protein
MYLLHTPLYPLPWASSYDVLLCSMAWSMVLLLDHFSEYITVLSENMVDMFGELLLLLWSVLLASFVLELPLLVLGRPISLLSAQWDCHLEGSCWQSVKIQEHHGLGILELLLGNASCSKRLPLAFYVYNSMRFPWFHMTELVDMRFLLGSCLLLFGALALHLFYS